MTLNSVCSYLAMSTSYFSSIFKNYTGETFIEALTRKRVEKAKFLLENTSRKITRSPVTWATAIPIIFPISLKKLRV